MPATNAAAASELVELVVRRDASGAVALVGQVAEQGVDLPHFAADLVDALRALLHASLGNASALTDRLERSAADRLAALLPQTTPRAIAALIDRFEKARRQSKGETIPSLPLELAIVESCVEEEGDRGGERGDRRDRPAGPQGKVDFKESGVGSGRAEEKGMKASGGQGLKDASPPAALLPPDPHPTVLGSVPVISIDQVRSKWPDVFQLVKQANASLPVVLQTGEISKVDGDRIEISFAYSLHADTLNDERNRRILAPVLERVYGARMHLHGTYRKGESPDAAVDMLLEEFGGSAA
jgi:hypothetical protein